MQTVAGLCISYIYMGLSDVYCNVLHTDTAVADIFEARRIKQVSVWYST
jgi:hypothetical protein